MEEKVIEAVRGYPVLYDTSHEDYFRIKFKDEIWENIAKELKMHSGKYFTESILFILSPYSYLYL